MTCMLHSYTSNLSHTHGNEDVCEVAESFHPDQSCQILKITFGYLSSGFFFTYFAYFALYILYKKDHLGSLIFIHIIQTSHFIHIIHIMRVTLFAYFAFYCCTYHHILVLMRQIVIVDNWLYAHGRRWVLKKKGWKLTVPQDT